MKISTYFPVLLVIVALQSCNQSQNWNQYLGPNRNATIQDATILPSWEDSQPVELWSQPLGEGYGGASIFEDEVFILDRVKGESDILRCFDLLSGEESWSYSYQAPGEISYPGSRAVPTVSEKCIWSVGPQGDVYCFDKESRSPVWNFNVKDSYHSRIPYFGNSQSPVIFGDLMIISLASEKAGLAAFDKLSGELVWESRAYTGITTHVSPMLANFGGVDQVIIYSPSDRKDSTMIAEVVSFDVNTGEEL